MPESLFYESCRSQEYKFIKKETLAQVFSCEFCETSKITFLYRTPLVAASEESNSFNISGEIFSFALTILVARTCKFFQWMFSFVFIQ